jgi:hypothetical protein
MRAAAPEESIFVAGFDPATGVITDPQGRRIALLDPDGNFSVDAVATLFSYIAASPQMVDAIAEVRDSINRRRGHLPPPVVAAVTDAAREVLQKFFDAGGSLD